MTGFCVHLVTDQPRTGASSVVRQGTQHGPPITYKITLCWVTLLQQARWAAVMDQPSSLRPPCSRPSILTCFCYSPLEDFRANCTSRCPCAVWKSCGTKRAATGAEIMRESIMKFPPGPNLCRLQPLTLLLQMYIFVIWFNLTCAS